MSHRGTSMVSVGDWVEACSPGIWQVLKILAGFYEARFSLHERKRVSRRSIVFARRLVDGAWRKAFRVESCSADLVHPLTERQRERLVAYMAANPSVVAEFGTSQLELPGHITLFRFNMPQPPDFEERRTLVARVFEGIDAGLTNDEILERIASSPLATYQSGGISNTTVRLHCRSHELRDRQFVFRDVDVQPF